VLDQLVLGLKPHGRVGRSVPVTLADDDLGGAGQGAIGRDPAARAAVAEPAVEPGDQRLAELDEGRPDAVIARAVDEKHADAGPGGRCRLLGRCCGWIAWRRQWVGGHRG
jgi:hypothetical protein